MDLQLALTSENEDSADISETELCDELLALARRITKKSSPKDILDYLCEWAWFLFFQMCTWQCEFC